MTKTQKHHWIFKLWIKLRGFVALVIVLAGVCVGLLSLLLPFEGLYQKHLEQFLQKQWGLDVSIEEIEGSWHGYGPYFALKNLSLKGNQQIDLESASLSINVYQLLIPGGRTGIDLSINKAELGMIHSPEGGASITINDKQDEARFTDMLDRVLTTGSLRVDELTLNVANQAGDVLLSGVKAGFLLEQDKTNRAFNLLINNENSNQAIVIKSLGKRSQSLTKDANWHVAVEQFDISQLNELVNGINLPHGILDGQLWMRAVDGDVKSATGQFSWTNPIDGFSFDFALKYEGEQNKRLMTVKVNHLKIKHLAYDGFVVQLQRFNQQSQIKSDNIPVALLSKLIIDFGQSDGVDYTYLERTEGEIAHFELSYDHTEEAVTTGFLAFSDFAMQHEAFDVQGLSGELVLTNNEIQVLLDSEAGQLIAPKIYRGQLQWQQLSAQINVNYGVDKPQFTVNNLWCECQDFNLSLWLNYVMTDEPWMILSSQLTAVEVAQTWKYWPHLIWKDKTIKWLDESLLKGQVETGYVFVHGKMVPHAFKTEQAAFISRAYIRGVNNQFRPEWPMVENLNATAVFSPDEIHVKVNDAVSNGILISDAQVDIDSLEAGILDVVLTANSRNNQLLNYINKSPLSSNLKLSEAISLSGRQTVDLSFDVPLKSKEKQAFNPSGTVVFENGGFATEHFSLENIHGPVNLEGYDLIIRDLPAELKSAAVKLNGKIITKSDEGFLIDVDIDGLLNADYLLDMVNQSLPIEGESEWHINIKNQHDQLKMQAQSNLSGVTSQLPAPLDKSIDEKKMLTISCDIPCENSLVELNFDNQIISTIDSQAGQYHLKQLRFINSQEASEEAVMFGGAIKELDLDQWLSLMSLHKNSQQEPSELPFSEISINIEKLTFMSRVFDNIELHITRNDNSYDILVDSEAIKGKVVIDDDVIRKGIVAEFEYLNWIDAIDEQDIIKSPVDSPVPDIHLWVEHFSYLDIPLGQFRMEMRNVADGIKVEQLSIKSALAEINVSGAWNKTVGVHGKSEFNVVMFSEKIADFLQTMGFNAPISNAQTVIELNAQWEGAPSQFNIANIDGDLEIKLGKGEVLDQQPGFGRVLGLFNLTNLPRRLILDFRDVLAEGLLFDNMEGHFRINQGVAHTEDFLIEASSAKIHIVGDVGFADQSYAQIITIRPQIGKTFPTIGAIAGGPVGAAAGFLVQGLFNKKLKEKNEIIYQVTGTWDEPIIELISDE